MHHEPYTDVTEEEARAMLDKFIATDCGACADPYRYIASIMYGVALENVTTEQRWEAKRRNFMFLHDNTKTYEEALSLMESHAQIFAANRKELENEEDGR